MNIEQAKQIDICSFLDSIGGKCAKQTQSDAWYYALDRDERTASLHVFKNGTRWHDFGEGVGGDIIDLVKHCYKCSNTTQALYQISALLGKNGNNIILPRKEKTTFKTSANRKKARIISIGELSTPLLRYSRSRGINDATIRQVCRQVNFQNANDKQLYAIGFENNSFGWELRNPFYKGCIGNKDITAHVEVADEPIVVCEGFFDYLSIIELGWTTFLHNIIVLNSTALLNTAISFLLSRQVILCLDNDPAGKNAGIKIRQSCNVVEDWSSRYAAYNDVNEYLIR